MKIFIDANVLVSVLNKEYPLFTYSSRVLSLKQHKNFALYTSPTCLAIAFYFASKKSGDKKAKEKIEILTTHINLTTIDEACCKKAISDPRVLDLEDGFQYFSAISHKCKYIITENGSDFHFSSIPVMDCENFLKNELK